MSPLGFSAQPLTRCAAIITVAARIEAPIVLCLVRQDLIVNTRALAGVDRDPQQLALRLARKQSANNHLCVWEINFT